ncbi:MAG: MBL fold metallo-hydrolase, partial [Acidobacteria bacterium]|nr:MBL fold metallo-hydrolase [Acidobacteriota bacterium]
YRQKKGQNIASRLYDMGIALKGVFFTHLHFDHIAGNAIVSKFFKAEILIHKNDLELLRNSHEIAEHFGLIAEPSPEPAGFISEGDEIEIGTEKIRVIETPGHTKGGVSFYYPPHLFCGDSLFAGSIGRTDLEGGDFELLVKSIREKLFALPPETIVHPGHGKETTIGIEIGENPFLNGDGDSFV